MQVKISLPDELVGSMDETRGDISRSVWIQRQVENGVRLALAVRSSGLGQMGTSSSFDLDPVRGASGVRGATVRAAGLIERASDASVPSPVRVKPVPARPIVQKRGKGKS